MGASALKRLRYVSRFNQELRRQQVEEISRRAEQRNSQLGLTGILMTSGRLFFQVLEGPNEAVDAVFAQIRKDPRHTSILVLSSEEGVSERMFPDWSMRKIDLDEAANARLAPSRQVLERIADMRLELDKLTYQLERTIWEELARVE